MKSFFVHSRTPSLDELEANEVYDAWREFCKSDRQRYDLSVSNPTVVGLPAVCPDDLVLRNAVSSSYQASPQGLLETRRAIAQFYTEETGAEVNPDYIQLFASTSEAVGALMKLLCAPGDEVITCTPTYPLLDCLTALECVQLREVSLQDCAGEWCIDFWAIENNCNDKTRAVIVVSPNNPTGHCIQKAELLKLAEFCASRRIVLIIDEVFGSYLYHNRNDLVTQPAAVHCSRGLVISLSGLSKVCGLPQHKLGWAVFGGEESVIAEAMNRMQFITDSTLSVSGWVQRMAPYFLSHRHEFVDSCMLRMRHNLAWLHEFAGAGLRRWTVDGADGGWSVCIRLPGWADDTSAAMYLAQHGIRVFPGSFFGYRENQPTLVVSLLVEESIFRDGVCRMSDFLETFLG